MLVNKLVYEKKSVVNQYNSELITPPEIYLMKKYDSYIRKKVLDIGIGAGRTTSFILPISAQYYGIDYSDNMVQFAQSRFPNAWIKQYDARDLSCFENSTFDFVLFSFNGIDCVGHNDRLKIFSEIQRVLKTDGLFMFSSHNRDFKGNIVSDQFAGGGKIITKLLNNLTSPANLIRKAGIHLRCAINRKKLKIHELNCDEYAILNDGDQEFSTLYYYIDVKHQKIQLERFGLEMIEIVSCEGQSLPLGSICKNSPWLYYMASNFCQPKG